jgi:hypothetical protein
MPRAKHLRDAMLEAKLLPKLIANCQHRGTESEPTLFHTQPVSRWRRAQPARHAARQQRSFPQGTGRGGDASAQHDAPAARMRGAYAADGPVARQLAPLDSLWLPHCPTCSVMISRGMAARRQTESGAARWVRLPVNPRGSPFPLSPLSTGFWRGTLSVFPAKKTKARKM